MTTPHPSSPSRRRARRVAHTASSFGRQVLKDIGAGMMTFLFCTIQSVSFGASIEEGAPGENLFGKVRVAREHHACEIETYACVCAVYGGCGVSVLCGRAARVCVACSLSFLPTLSPT